jgi:hypothetical protein
MLSVYIQLKAVSEFGILNCLTVLRAKVDSLYTAKNFPQQRPASPSPATIMSPIARQPTTSTMDVYGPFTTDEKSSRPCQHDEHNMNFPCECPSSSHRACHKARLRRVILPIALSLLSVGALLLISYCSEIGDLLGVLGFGHGHGISLGKRQTTTSSSSSFTSNKCSNNPLFRYPFLTNTLQCT